jgi:hypothetical protein
MHGARKRRIHRNEARDDQTTPRGALIQAQVGLRAKSERVMNERRSRVVSKIVNLPV